MTTPARAAANAANAQLSTGPRTEAGKARSARNALTHGLTSKDLVVREDEKEDFDQFQQDLRGQHRPEGPAEMFAFNQVIRAAWNLERAHRLETDLCVNGFDPLLDESSGKVLDRIHRYIRQSERSYQRFTKELGVLQTNRVARNQTLTEEEAKQAPVLVSPKEILKTKRTQARVQEREAEDAMRAMLEDIDARAEAALARTHARERIEAKTAARKEGDAA